MILVDIELPTENMLDMTYYRRDSGGCVKTKNTAMTEVIDVIVPAMIMGVMVYELEIIAARRRQIAASRAEHEAALTSLDDELAELDVAERVINRLVLKAPVIPPPSHSRSGALTASIDAAVGTSRKPPNIPTIPEMIREILKADSELFTPPSLTPKEMAERIRLIWWPDVTPTEVSPIAWRMAKRKELVKDGPRYRLLTSDDFAAGEVRIPEGDEPPEEYA